MRILKDDIHDCEKCELYPCSLQDEVSKTHICDKCPIICCRYQLIIVAPCEIGKLEVDDIGGLKMTDDGWCYYYSKKEGCSIYDKRPVICRIASCRFIRRGGIPDVFKSMSVTNV